MKLPTLAGLDLADRLDAYHADPWRWIRDVVWTVDEVDREQPIKRFPVAACVRCQRYAGGDEVAYAGADVFRGGACRLCEAPLQELAYLRLLTRAWQAAGHPSHRYPHPTKTDPEPTPLDPTLVDCPPVLAIPKPRRMRLSWLMVALHTWLIITRPHVHAFVVSSKLEKSAELIERADGILRRVPQSLCPLPAWVPTGSVKGGLPMIEVPEYGSRLWGVAEGSDQLRQFTATCIYADEFGTWDRPRESYTAMKPCIEGGGQITLVSSAYPGPWAEMCEGSLTA